MVKQTNINTLGCHATERRRVVWHAALLTLTVAHSARTALHSAVGLWCPSRLALNSTRLCAAH